MKEIIIAEAQGFCWGVRRALDIVDQHGPVSILGDLIHNKQVVQELEQKKKRVIYNVTEDQKEPVVITAHGTEERQFTMLKEMGVEIVDTTCPLVSAIYRAGKQLEKDGFHIVIIGDKKHIEVKGIASRMCNPIVLDSEKEIEETDFPKKVGVICQSTFSQSRLDDLIQLIKKKVEELKIKNTICSPTKKRQIAAEELAQRVDLMVVVGGFHSSNTKKLVELSKGYVESYHVETADDLKQEWFQGKERVGITAGASTPDWIINEVYHRIEKF